jgi:hypothetical protein
MHSLMRLSDGEASVEFALLNDDCRYRISFQRTAKYRFESRERDTKLFFLRYSDRLG